MFFTQNLLNRVFFFNKSENLITNSFELESKGEQNWERRLEAGRLFQEEFQEIQRGTTLQHASASVWNTQTYCKASEVLKKSAIIFEHVFKKILNRGIFFSRLFFPSQKCSVIFIMFQYILSILSNFSLWCTHISGHAVCGEGLTHRPIYGSMG